MTIPYKFLASYAMSMGARHPSVFEQISTWILTGKYSSIEGVDIPAIGKMFRFYGCTNPAAIHSVRDYIDSTTDSSTPVATSLSGFSPTRVISINSNMTLTVNNSPTTIFQGKETQNQTIQGFFLINDNTVTTVSSEDQGDVCYIEDQIIITNNDYLHKITLPNLCHTVIYLYLANLRTLTTINLPRLYKTEMSLMIGGTWLLNTLSLPSLKESYGIGYWQDTGIPIVTYLGDVQFIKNYTLSTIDLPKLDRVGWNLWFETNNVSEINIPLLTNIGQWFFIYEEPVLEEVTMPSLVEIGNYAASGTDVRIAQRYVGIYGGFVCYFNPGITTITMPLLVNIWGDVVMFTNSQLATISMPELLYIQGALVIDYSWNDARFDFPVKLANIDGYFEFCNNNATTLLTMGSGVCSIRGGVLVHDNLTLLLVDWKCGEQLNTFRVYDNAVLDKLSNSTLLFIEPQPITHYTTFQNEPDLIITGNDDLEYARLTAVLNIGRNVNISSNPAMADIDLSAVTEIGNHSFQSTIPTGTGELRIENNDTLTEINLASLVNVTGDIYIRSNTALTTLTLTAFVPRNGQRIDLLDNDLDDAAVNSILAKCVANAEFVSGYVRTSGNAAPTGQGLTDKQTLIDRGVTVLTAI